jgi:uncharacterized protein (TIGR02646 family)
MIRLHRQQLPQELAARLNTWRAELLQRIAAGQDVSDFTNVRYRDAALKNVLKAESHDKCIYCETKILHAQFGDVEHIRPKSRFRERALDHDNLALSCAVCNNAKGDAWDDAIPFLNPYAEDPAQQIRAFGPMLTALPQAHNAMETIRQLTLNRTGLLERRAERLQNLRALLNEYQVAVDQNMRRIAERELVEATKADREFAFVVRCFLREHGLPLPAY